MTKAVFFDVDGTLIDTVDLHAKAWVEALQHFGIRSTFEDMRLQIGKGGDQVLLALLPPAELERKGEEIQEVRSDLFKRRYLPEARAFPAVRELFERIRASGQRIVLASSGKADEVARYKEVAGIADLIDAVVVGDTPYDAEAARTAGMKTVGVLCGGFAEDALRSAGCVAVYRDPEHLLQNYERSLLA